MAALQSLITLAGGWECRPPQRRSAYDSNDLRSARRSVALLLRLAALLPSPSTVGPGCWSQSWISLLNQLASLHIVLPRHSLSALHQAAHAALLAQRALVARLQRELRQARHKRWLHALPTLWKERPGVIFHWLHQSGAPWGTTPILDESGMQCLSASAVDAAVRTYWVDKVLRCHASVDGTLRWTLFFLNLGSLSQFWNGRVHPGRQNGSA